MMLRFSLYHWFSAIWCALVCCSYVSYDTCALLSSLVMWVYYFHRIWKMGHFFFQIIFTVYPLPPSRFQLHIGRQLHSILQVTVTLFMDFKIFPPLCISFFNNFHSCNFKFTDHYYALSNMLLNLHCETCFKYCIFNSKCFVYCIFNLPLHSVPTFL